MRITENKRITNTNTNNTKTNKYTEEEQIITSPWRDDVWYAGDGIRRKIPRAFAHHPKDDFHPYDCRTYQLRIHARERQLLIDGYDIILALKDLLPDGYQKDMLTDFLKYYYLWTFTMSLNDCDHIKEFGNESFLGSDSESVRVAKSCVREHFTALRLIMQEEAWEKCKRKMIADGKGDVHAQRIYRCELPNFDPSTKALIREIRNGPGVTRRQFLVDHGHKLLVHLDSAPELHDYALWKLKMTCTNTKHSLPKRREIVRQTMRPQSGYERDFSYVEKSSEFLFVDGIVYCVGILLFTVSCIVRLISQCSRKKLKPQLGFESDNGFGFLSITSFLSFGLWSLTFGSFCLPALGIVSPIYSFAFVKQFGTLAALSSVFDMANFCLKSNKAQSGFEINSPQSGMEIDSSVPTPESFSTTDEALIANSDVQSDIRAKQSQVVLDNKSNIAELNQQYLTSSSANNVFQISFENGKANSLRQPLTGRSDPRHFFK